MPTVTTTNTSPLVERLLPQPLVRSDAVPGYGAVFNAGLLHHDGLFHLFARGVRTGYRRNRGTGPRFSNYISDILVFTSEDGCSYDFGYQLALAGDHGVACYEDPRIQWVTSQGAEHLVMTYTNLPPSESGLPWRIGAHYLHYVDDQFVLDEGGGGLLGPDGVENKDAVIETPHGLLLFFHERNASGAYTMKAALLDNKTGAVVAQLDQPIMEPNLEWERRGDVDEVVFVQGVHRLTEDALYLVYGAADSHVGGAKVHQGPLLDALWAQASHNGPAS